MNIKKTLFVTLCGLVLAGCQDNITKEINTEGRPAAVIYTEYRKLPIEDGLDNYPRKYIDICGDHILDEVRLYEDYKFGYGIILEDTLTSKDTLFERRAGDAVEKFYLVSRNSIQGKYWQSKFRDAEKKYLQQESLKSKY